MCTHNLGECVYTAQYVYTSTMYVYTQLGRMCIHKNGQPGRTVYTQKMDNLGEPCIHSDFRVFFRVYTVIFVYSSTIRFSCITKIMIIHEKRDFVGPIHELPHESCVQTLIKEKLYTVGGCVSKVTRAGLKITKCEDEEGGGTMRKMRK